MDLHIFRGKIIYSQKHLSLNSFRLCDLTGIQTHIIISYYTAKDSHTVRKVYTDNYEFRKSLCAMPHIQGTRHMTYHV